MELIRMKKEIIAFAVIISLKGALCSSRVSSFQDAQNSLNLIAQQGQQDASIATNAGRFLQQQSAIGGTGENASSWSQGPNGSKSGDEIDAAPLKIRLDGVQITQPNASPNANATESNSNTVPNITSQENNGSDSNITVANQQLQNTSQSNTTFESSSQGNDSSTDSLRHRPDQPDTESDVLEEPKRIVKGSRRPTLAQIKNMVKNKIALHRQTKPGNVTTNTNIMTLSGKPQFSSQVIFKRGMNGYGFFRIPAIIRTTSGTLLAFCEGRKKNPHDSGDIDTVMRASKDDGVTWSPLKTIVDGKGSTMGNPVPVVDHTTGVLTLVLVSNRGSDGENSIRDGSAPFRRVWKMHSIDDGVTWTQSEEISRGLRKETWTWYAVGPGHGIQLKSGRLVVGAHHTQNKGVSTKPLRSGLLDYSHVIYSDDSGLTWRLGATSKPGTGESSVAETSTGGIYMNSRNMIMRIHTHQVVTARSAETQLQPGLIADLHRDRRDAKKKPLHKIHRKMRALDPRVRYSTWIADDGVTVKKSRPEPSLIEPTKGSVGCQASLLNVRLEGGPKTNCSVDAIFFANPANHERSRMTVFASTDDGEHWMKVKTVNQGYAAYSDMAVTQTGKLALLYESKVGDITVDLINLAWLLSPQKRVKSALFRCGAKMNPAPDFENN